MSTLLPVLGIAAALAAVTAWALGIRYIPHHRVGVVEKLWSLSGALEGGRIMALDGRAGFQSGLLRGGFHFGLYPWQYRVHKAPLVLVTEGRLGYVYARDGEPLRPTQTLGRVVDSNHYQDAEAFLTDGGQRGRQRAILREGLYAIHPVLFVVITQERVYAGPMRDGNEDKLARWQRELLAVDAFSPVVIGLGGANAPAEREKDFAGGDVRLSPQDTIGVITVHDGPPIPSGEIIAPEVRPVEGGPDHAYFQNPEAFLALGGRRGRQLQVLTDGTFFINRWFATVEVRSKTLVPIGYVGVVVSYHGIVGDDVTGEAFRYGEQVEAGHRGVWKRALPTGKYPLNPFAVKVELVPTVNFVLRWVTGLVEEHQYDEDLKSIDIITADGYEPSLPLSLVLHIDYEKAPSVIQRFGDVQRLINQTLDPILSAYFRDVAQSSNMLDLLTQRDEIQRRATEELGRRFREYDINCIAVLIGRPESRQPEGETDPIEGLFDQLRQRRLAEEQVATYALQREAAGKLRELKDARAAADKQAELTSTRLDVEIAGNRGEAELAQARRLAKRDVARAHGESRSKVVVARGESRSCELIGRGEATRIAKTGLAEAAVFFKKIQAYGDPRLFALNLVADKLSRSRQPLVPQRVMAMQQGDGENGKDGTATTGLFGPLLALLLGERGGIDLAAGGDVPEGLEDLQRLAEGFAVEAEEDAGTTAA